MHAVRVVHHLCSLLRLVDGGDGRSVHQVAGWPRVENGVMKVQQQAPARPPA